MPSDRTTHPTAGRCKRCGAELTQPWLDHPITPGELVANRWCSDDCYAKEQAEQSQQACRAHRMRSAAGQRGEAA